LTHERDARRASPSGRSASKAELRPTLELIRDRVEEHDGQARDLLFFASFEAEPDLAERVEEILEAELGR
jgi:hypothetical protein